jgi:hypothetical protein
LSIKTVQTMKNFSRKNVIIEGNKISFTLSYKSRYGVIDKECFIIAKNNDDLIKAKQLQNETRNIN